MRAVVRRRRLLIDVVLAPNFDLLVAVDVVRDSFAETFIATKKRHSFERRDDPPRHNITSVSIQILQIIFKLAHLRTAEDNIIVIQRSSLAGATRGSLAVNWCSV